MKKTYYLTEAEGKKCEEHAKILAIKRYKMIKENRNCPSIEKLYIDFLSGKVGECAVQNCFSKIDENCKVDFEIYERSTFAADLKFRNKKLHVKSYNVRDSYSTSWTFQYGNIMRKFGNDNYLFNPDNGHKDDLFRNYDENDYAVLTTVTTDDCYSGRIDYVIKVSKLFEYKMFQLPRNPTYWKSKRCIYLSRILEYEEELGLKKQHLVH